MLEFKNITKRLSTVLALAFALITGCATAQRGPLRFAAPPNWRVSFKQNVSFYSLTAPGTDSVLMIYRWPAPMPASGIPDALKTMADGFKDELRKSLPLEGSSWRLILTADDNNIHNIEGPAVTGKFVRFDLTDGAETFVQTMFFIQIRSFDIWQGQFTGSRESWTNALAVLQSIQPDF